MHNVHLTILKLSDSQSTFHREDEGALAANFQSRYTFYQFPCNKCSVAYTPRPGSFVFLFFFFILFSIFPSEYFKGLNDQHLRNFTYSKVKAKQ
jgi:hypothetical protein